MSHAWGSESRVQVGQFPGAEEAAVFNSLAASFAPWFSRLGHRCNLTAGSAGSEIVT